MNPRNSLNYIMGITAMDATIIGLAWYAYYSKTLDMALDPIKMTILGLSIWLVYMSDRLFDVRHGEVIQTRRHQFAKRYQAYIWLIWFIILIADIYLSFCYLSLHKIYMGFILTGLLLIYTLLNQFIFKKIFPKELFVAAIFSYGVLFLIDVPINYNTFIPFALICFLNCIILSEKESAIDYEIGMCSLGSILGRKKVLIISLMVAIGFLIESLDPLSPYFLVSLSLLMSSIFLRNLKDETFRAIIEAQFALYPVAFSLL